VNIALQPDFRTFYFSDLPDFRTFYFSDLPDFRTFLSLEPRLAAGVAMAHKRAEQA